jgi:hypothetical protein
MVAHDPLFRKGYAAYLDESVLRCRRIFVPALAFLLGFGQPRLIDSSYIFVIVGFTALGAYWLARWCDVHGRHAAWGLAFLLCPATLVGMDRLTIDGALASLAAATALYVTERRWMAAWTATAAACLVRETGAILLVAAVIHLLVIRHRRRAALFCTAILPTAAWYVFLQMSIPSAPSAGIPPWVHASIEPGIFARLIDPIDYPFTPSARAAAQALDTAGLVGMILAVSGSVVVMLRARGDFIALAAFGHVVLFVLVNRTGFWDSALGYGRPFGVLLVLLAMYALRMQRAPWWNLAPSLLISARIVFEMLPQFIGIFQAAVPGSLLLVDSVLICFSIERHFSP